MIDNYCVEASDVKVDYVTFTIDVINERAKHIASEVYKQKLDLTLRELRLMRFIAREPGITVTQLFEQAHIEKTLTSKAIASLVRKKVVVRVMSPTDARHNNLYLSPEGVELVRRGDDLGIRMENEMLSSLSSSEIQQLQTILNKIAETNKYPEQAIRRHLAHLDTT